MTERTAGGRAQGALKAIGMEETPVSVLEREDALFVLTPMTLVYQDGGGTRRVTLRDLTRIHSDDQGVLRVETPAGTALTATLLGFDVAQVQAFFVQVRDTTARAKEQPVSPLPTPGGLKTFGASTPDRSATPATTTQTSASPASTSLAPTSPASASPASASPDRGSPDRSSPERAAPVEPVSRPPERTPLAAASPIPQVAAPSPAPAPVPTRAPVAPVPSPSAPASPSGPASAAASGLPGASRPVTEVPAARPVVISSSAFTPSAARTPAMTPEPARAPERPVPSAPAPAPVAAPVQEKDSPAPVSSAPVPAPAPASWLDELARQADAVEGLTGRLRFLGGVLFLGTLALAVVQFTSGARLDGLWTLLSGGVGTIALLALADLARLLVLSARAARPGAVSDDR